MRRLSILALTIILGLSGTSWATNARTLKAEVESTTLKSVDLEAGVGDITVTVGDASVIVASVDLKPRRGGFFSSLKKAEQQVQDAIFQPKVSGDTLILKINNVDGDRRFEEEWTLTIPADLALGIELGVGNFQISGTQGDLELELGVGDTTIQVNGGSLDIEVGVGDITLRGPSGAYRSVETASGVGDVRIVADGQKITGEGFIAHSAEWHGDGDSTIEAESGVGDIKIILD